MPYEILNLGHHQSTDGLETSGQTLPQLLTRETLGWTCMDHSRRLHL